MKTTHERRLAGKVAFVAGPESSYITAANLTVDGGMNALPQVEAPIRCPSKGERS